MSRMPKSLWLALTLTLGAVTALALAISASRTPPPHTAWKDPKSTTSLSLNFSPYYLNGADPELGSPVSEETMRRALDAIRPFADTIRTFGVSGELEKLYRIAKEEYGLRVIAGCWIGPGYDDERVQTELALLAGLGNNGLADILVVGSEGLLRGDYDAEALIGWLDDLREKLDGGVPVGISEAAADLLGNPEVMQAADVALFTCYPYFNGVAIEDAAADFLRMYRLLQRNAGQTKLICSETGWKFEGKSQGSAVPSPQNASRYFDEIIELSRRENLEICYFEALEEKWKSKYDDAGWGLLDEDLNPRLSVSGSLARLAGQNKEAK